MRLGIVGGTFDPVHLGHLVLAECAREQLALERVLWVPAGDPWRKPDRQVTAAKHRVTMVQLAIQGNEAFQLCLLEVERRGPSYSVDTLAELKRTYPDGDLFFLVGLDALEDLPNWRQPGRIIQLATMAVTSRSGRRRSIAELERLLPGLGRRVVWVEMPRVDISATDLRERASRGRSLRYVVPDAVATYIGEQELYRQR